MEQSFREYKEWQRQNPDWDNCQVMDANVFIKIEKENKWRKKKQKEQKTLRFKIRRWFAKRKGEIA